MAEEKSSESRKRRDLSKLSLSEGANAHHLAPIYVLIFWEDCLQIEPETFKQLIEVLTPYFYQCKIVTRNKEVDSISTILNTTCPHTTVTSKMIIHEDDVDFEDPHLITAFHSEQIIVITTEGWSTTSQYVQKRSGLILMNGAEDYIVALEFYLMRNFQHLKLQLKSSASSSDTDSLAKDKQPIANSPAPLIDSTGSSIGTAPLPDNSLYVFFDADETFFYHHIFAFLQLLIKFLRDRPKLDTETDSSDNSADCSSSQEDLSNRELSSSNRDPSPETPIYITDEPLTQSSLSHSQKNKEAMADMVFKEIFNKTIDLICLKSFLACFKDELDDWIKTNLKEIQALLARVIGSKVTPCGWDNLDNILSCLNIERLTAMRTPKFKNLIPALLAQDHHVAIATRSPYKILIHDCLRLHLGSHALAIPVFTVPHNINKLRMLKELTEHKWSTGLPLFSEATTVNDTTLCNAYKERRMCLIDDTAPNSLDPNIHFIHASPGSEAYVKECKIWLKNGGFKASSDTNISMEQTSTCRFMTHKKSQSFGIAPSGTTTPHSLIRSH